MHRRQLLQRLPALGAGVAFGLGGLVAPAGAAEQRVRLGQSAALTGPQGRYGRDIRDGVLAALAAANRQEGPRGLQFELQTLDDGGSRERSVANTRTLIDTGAAALVGYTGDAAAEACLGLVDQHQMALIGTGSGCLGGGARGRGGAAPVRAGADVEYRRISAYMKTFGARRLAHVHLQDASAADQAAMAEALKAAGLQPALTLGIARQAPSLLPVVHKLLGAQLDAVVFTTHAAPALAIIQQMNVAQFRGMHFVSSLAGQDLIDGIGATGRSVVMSLVVPRPGALGVGVVAQCRQDLAALGPGSAALGVTSLEGYIAGRVAVEAARQAARAGGASRARIREALATLNTDLGGYRVNYSASNRQGSQHVELVVIDRFGRMLG
ncbi:MAG: ABC transporter substrate-binding protein [Burkholderiales bacterium]|nr:ABC transporter substrate-binding protein [Burkholderiales bacterium]